MQQWASKMLVVGQGGVGKTSLLRSLKGESFDFQETTTRGVALGTLDAPCPNDPAVTMQLNTWDFGGQEIYHATHQFFLTNRSLFVLVWNARQGFEQGRLYYWLDTITALAPDSPILIVATWTDERDPDLPLAEIRVKYPRVVGQWAVSNQTRAGIEDLRQVIAQTAAELPLMGEIWPGTWLSAANALRARPEKYISPNRLFEVMSEHGVSEGGAPVLARWLHELGEILFFRDSEDLRDIVILKPQWVTEYISKVLESDEVIDSLGLYTREHMERLWHDLEPPMREHFLKLMERFDLSYRTLDNREISLVVERLPLDEAPYQEAWEAPLKAEECNEIAMRFRLDATMPAGVPTWFIARTHRFTTKTHWRTGALFADGPDRRHMALVRAFPHDRYLELAVRGPAPQNFFALLKDGIEVTLARFPGLPVRRMIPCPGHDGQPCRHEFDHDQLIKRLNKKPTIECPEAIEDVSVAELLFGWDWNTRDAVLEKIEQLRAEEAARHEAVVGKLNDLTQLVQREFAVIFRREQAKDESHCPSVFVLRPSEDATGWGRLLQGMKQAVMGQPITLQLYCQAPGCWHPTRLDGRYTIEDPSEWFKALSPILRRLIPVLKFAVPLVGPWMSWIDPQLYEQQFKADIELMDALAGSLGDLKPDRVDAELAEAVGEARDPERAEGSALRALRKLLDEKDPQQHWGGLKKVLTPEGHYLWLCEHHARAYAR